MKSSYFMVVAGLVMMAWGIGDVGEGTQGVVAFAVGFVVVLSGIVLRTKKTFDEQPTVTDKTERDTPAIIRFTGVTVALLSLVLPYFSQPVSTQLRGLNMSFVEMLAAAQSGVDVEISYLFVLLVGVVIVGAFISIFHHFGGYIMLLASSSVVFVAFADIGSIQAMPYHVEGGLVLMVLAALIIISSALSTPDTGFSEGSDWITT